MRDLTPLGAPCGGVGSRFDFRSRPQHGTGELVEVAAGPGARRVCGEVRRGQRGLIVSGASALATRQESNDADPLSVGFSTHSTRTQAACPPCNTSHSPSLYALALPRNNGLTLAGRNAPLCRALDSGVRLSEGVSREVAVLDAVDAHQGTDNAEQK